LNEDYKVILLPREKKHNAGRCEEELLLNVDTFKNLCMLTKSEESKKICKYYVKLHNI
jgi:phage anti-repressor protein